MPYLFFLLLSTCFAPCVLQYLRLGEALELGIERNDRNESEALGCAQALEDMWAERDAWSASEMMFTAAERQDLALADNDSATSHQSRHCSSVWWAGVTGLRALGATLGATAAADWRSRVLLHGGGNCTSSYGFADAVAGAVAGAGVEVKAGGVETGLYAGVQESAEACVGAKDGIVTQPYMTPAHSAYSAYSACICTAVAFEEQLGADPANQPSGIAKQANPPASASVVAMAAVRVDDTGCKKAKAGKSTLSGGLGSSGGEYSEAAASHQ